MNMSSASGYIKGACVHCAGHIEFPAAALGATVTCPHCAQHTALLENLIQVPAAPAVVAPVNQPSTPRPSNARTPADQPTSKPVSKVSVACPGCGLEVSIKAETCPGCGAILKEKRGAPWGAIVAGVALLAVIGAGAVFGLKFKGKGPDTTSGGTDGAAKVEETDNRKMTAPKRQVQLSGKFEVTDYQIERLEGRSLVYVVGTVTNGTPQQAFSVRVNFDLSGKSGDSAGTATDYVQSIPSGEAWNFRALVLDTNAVSAKLSALEKEME
jgi:hypothetical protein